MRQIALHIVVLFFAALAVLPACEDPNQVELPDEDTLSREERLAIETDSITAYIELQGYDSVFITESGLHLIPITTGTGDLADFGDILTLDLDGTLLDGIIFETTNEDLLNDINYFGPGLTSRVRNLPGENTIRGVNEGLTYMNPGSRYIMLIPSSLAFGQFGSAFFGVGPYRVVKYDVRLHVIRR